MAGQLALGFGDLVRELRAEAGLTQEELAEAAGLSPRSVSDLERGIHRTARKDTAELLAGALGLAGPARPRFVAAARGRAPAEEVLAAVREAAAPGGPAPGPYLGLVPFEERDARLFYGRDELAGQLARRLAERPGGAGILLVTGESGSGKSSLLRAGLLPRLAAGVLGPGSQRWPRRVIRPTASPLRELAMDLAEMAGADPVSVYRSLAAAPGEAPMLAEHAVRGAAGRGADPGPGGPAGAAAGAPPRLVLVVDQFEEVFTAGGDDDTLRGEREAFVAALHAAATIAAGPAGLPPALVVAAVRADYLGRLIGYPPLKAALDAGPFTVGPMSEAELRQAVTGPAAEAGLVVEPALAEAVIAELRDEGRGGLGTGVLPLMSQAMAATWEHREGNELTLRGYRRAGGVADAVNRGAQAAYDALTGGQQDAARLVFTQLTAITPDGRLARRRCRRADLSSPGTPMAADVDAVIGAFSARRLLVLGEDSVEIAHDALLQAWKQLRDWLGDDQLDRALYSQVVTDTATWEGHGRDPAYLYRPGRLATIDAAAARWRGAPARYPPLPATSAAFLSAAHHAARRTMRRRQGLIALLTTLVIGFAAATVVAVHARQQVTHQLDVVTSGLLSTQSRLIGDANPALSKLLSVAAWRINPSSTARRAMLAAAARPGIAILAAPSAVDSVAFSPNGKTLADGDASGNVQFWDLATRQQLGALPVSGQVTSVAFRPDGKVLATGSTDGRVRLWDVASTQPIGSPFTARVGGVSSVAFSPNGKILAAGSGDGGVRLWDMATHQPIGRLPSSGHASVNSVAFSRGGTVAVGSNDGSVRLWDVTTRQPIGGPLTGQSGPVTSVAFSPDGTTLATGSDDGTVVLWDMATRQQIGSPIINGQGAGVDALAFSPDGAALATGSYDGAAKLWDVATHRLRRSLTSQGAPVTSVAFSPDGHTLASGSVDQTVRLWNLATPGHNLGDTTNLVRYLCALAGRPLTRAEWAQYLPHLPYQRVCP